MRWQDIVIAVSYVFFNLALIGSLKSKSKPALSTSITTGILNFVLTFTQLSMGMWLAALGAIINGSLWFVLAYQKLKQRKR